MEEEKEREERAEMEPPSAKGTIRGIPVPLKQEREQAEKLKDAIDTPFEDPQDATPFEEPKVDEFGTGHGV